MMAIRLVQPLNHHLASSVFLRALRLSSTTTTTTSSSPAFLLTENENDSVEIDLPTLEPSSDAGLLAEMLVRHHNPFHAMESSLQLHGITLTPPLLHQTLLRLRHNSKIALALFHYSQSLPPSASVPATPTTTTYNLLIDILGKVRQFDVAWQLIIDMDQRNIRPSPSTFLILIRRLIAAGLTRQAIRAFNDMEPFLSSADEEEEGNSPAAAVEEQHFCFFLDTLCKYGYVKVAVEVFNHMKSRFRPGVRMYTILICGWCKIGRIDMAERFLREMCDRGIEPNVVTYNVLLNGICRRARLHPEMRFERTLRLADCVFDEMSQRGVEPDVTSFSIVLHVYSRAHKPQLTLDKLKLMKEKGLCPTVATYTSVVKCLCSCGRIEDAEDLLGEMMRSGISPNAATYNCFFKEYKGRKDLESALKLYRKMREDGICIPGIHTYNILLGMFMDFNRMEIVNEIWEDLEASGSGPDLDSYTLLIHGLCGKQKWKEACQYFVEMIERGLLPQKFTFETLYRGLIQSDMLRTWRRLKKKLEEESITFGSEFQNYHLKPYRR